jgi:cobalt/nickel transport system permease protein
MVAPLLAMHAADGLFSMPVNLVFAAVVVAWLAGAVASLSRRGDHRLVPIMGIMAAFIFAGQMVNFPIASGTTGHLLGGTLAAILLGPWAGAVVMAVVVFFQALLGDGGITTLGPNIFNMGLIGTGFAYFLYRAVVGHALAQPARVVGASFFAAWLATVLASFFVSLQLAVSHTVSLTLALPAMVGTHMLIGIGEALITALVTAFVLKTRPDLLYGQRPTPAARRVGRPVIVLGLAGSLVVATALSLLPTLWDFPDGLESVGMAQGFVCEEPVTAESGALTMLPAYPLGVRLESVSGHVTAVHQYKSKATGVRPGDVIERIGATPVPDLASAAAALRFDADKGRFGVAPGDELRVVVRRDGREQDLSIRASATPRAGARPPLIALLPDYTVPGVKGMVSTSIAGAIGTILMFVCALVIGRVLMRPSRLSRVVADAGKS